MKNNSYKKREELLRSVYSRRYLPALLKALSYLAILYSVFLFAFFCFVTVSENALSGAVAIISCGAAFLVLTAVRAFINSPRPYEILNVFETPPKNKKGHSFPSRHAFSVFCISAVAVPVAPALAIVGAVLGVILSVSRVLLGIHFIRDVAAGGAIGIVSGLLALLSAGLF